MFSLPPLLLDPSYLPTHPTLCSLCLSHFFKKQNTTQQNKNKKTKKLQQKANKWKSEKVKDQ